MNLGSAFLNLSGGEIVLIFAVVLFLFNFFQQPNRAPGTDPTSRLGRICNRMILFMAEGFGSGRIRFGPGTFGSIVGLAWFYLLLLPKSAVVFSAGIVLSIPFSMWVCGEGEKILGKKDPGSVVMDEIIAVPLCFASWLAILHFSNQPWPTPETLVSPHGLITLSVFVLFRLFDIAKPWPIRASQNLPGGWGITMDDLLAAIYVNAVVLIAWWAKPSLFQSV